MAQVKPLPQLKKELIEFVPSLTDEQARDVARWVIGELSKQNKLSYNQGYDDSQKNYNIQNPDNG